MPCFSPPIVKLANLVLETRMRGTCGDMRGTCGGHAGGHAGDMRGTRSV